MSVPKQLIETRIYETTRTYDTLKCLCYEAIEHGFTSVQVFPNMVAACHEWLAGSDVKINALISYPHGGFTIEQKVSEALDAVGNGASMVEVLVNTRQIKSNNFSYILREMQAVKAAVGSDISVKFNIEIECLTDAEARETALKAVEAGIDWLATSSGLYHTLDENKQDVPLITTVHEITLLKDVVGDNVKIQAEGNIADAAIAVKLLEAGADLISSEHALCLLGDE